MAQAVEGYQLRESQKTLAEAIDQALDEQTLLLAEAGTGIGKTFAYLLPALLSAQKVLVSTATKNLQEQIYTRDLPLVRQVLRKACKTALLKGRRNYFCHHHHEQLEQSPPANAEEKFYRNHINQFLARTTDGDLAGLSEIPEDALIRDAISSTADNCLGRECAFFEECFLQKARQKAKEADVVVVNHHLLLADFALKSEGFAEILPDIDAFIIDEAHHLPATAVQFLAKRLSYRQLVLLCQDAEAALIDEAPDALDARNAIKALRKAGRDALLSVSTHGEARFDMQDLQSLTPFWQALDTLMVALSEVERALAKHRERGKLLNNVAERVDSMLLTLHNFIHKKPTVQSEPEGDADAPQQAAPEARWLDTSDKGFMLCAAPVNAAGRFAGWVRQSEASWIFLSATLAVGGDFSHFIREMGLPNDVQTLLLDSPFDYRKQSLLYHPSDLPDPNNPNYTEAVLDAVLPVIERSGGRAFLLFTSYRALYAAERYLFSHDFHLLVQGKAPKGQLLEDFRQHKRAVLLGTSSFWEGVDVRGDALVVVVIDKLPFAAPNDPISKARQQMLKDKGLSPFMHDVLPQAVISLKQGVGRLIRDQHDYGVMVIADPRLTSKGYGKIFLDSLPRMTRTKQFAIVERFFNHHES
ncbi:ATP-dependent DNA helicase [Suttonella sp. R2A3]|uniref:ATP-dependent DNA helicase n=1 Tax=Suttonella sp. R2A3 TaxID=2908648 RepID=UPI001F46FE41|nr:ATP-dependent DNA helicase [Suttonella sp. R2A3]UJF24995.1 ATP-dependent DNA helicase [Suttonella sp. R2A3]